MTSKPDIRGGTRNKSSKKRKGKEEPMILVLASALFSLGIVVVVGGCCPTHGRRRQVPLSSVCVSVFLQLALAELNLNATAPESSRSTYLCFLISLLLLIRICGMIQFHASDLLCFGDLAVTV
jgi:hypothetical protein